jgi:hypothetical protein
MCLFCYVSLLSLFRSLFLKGFPVIKKKKEKKKGGGGRVDKTAAGFQCHFFTPSLKEMSYHVGASSVLHSSPCGVSSFRSSVFLPGQFRPLQNVHEKAK